VKKGKKEELGQPSGPAALRAYRGYNWGHTSWSRRRRERRSCVRISRSESLLVEVEASGALRLAFRLPIHLYRLNLGWLFGHRGLLLIHQGRKSSLLRETVLEVALYDPDIQGSVALSAWGEKADWYRNIEAIPAYEVRTGGQRYVAEQRFLTPEENHTVILEYARRHPLALRFFFKAFGFGYPLEGLEDERQSTPSPCHWWLFHPETKRTGAVRAAEKRIPLSGR
jgi:deazaflavin-dependent oxidoreductase (nitroreductase family)